MTDTQQLSRVTRINEKLNHEAAGSTVVSRSAGGLSFRSMGEVMEFAKLMAVSDVGIRKHLRGNPGACLAVCMQAIEWDMSAFQVANKSYLVNDQIAYESQLIHAVVENRAPIIGRLRCRYSGAGDSRTCTVWARAKDDPDPLEFTSPPIGNIQPKNSPLWRTKPDLQLFYNASRDWARMYFPDVIMGVYAEDEFESPAPVLAQAKGAAGLAAKLKARELPDTQLSDEEAERIIEQKAAQARNESVAPPPAEPAHPSAGQPDGADIEGVDAEPEVQPTWPDILPEHARADMRWLDDLLRARKGDLTLHQARSRFADKHKPHSWSKVSREEQDRLYMQLRQGEMFAGG